jgi:hypothetical protein
MENLGAILGWKFNNVPGIKTVDDVLIEWPISLGALPTDDQIQTWATEYLAHLSAIEATNDQKEMDFIDSFPRWPDVKAEIEAIEIAADALTQPTKGIIKDILKRLKKNSKAINWLVNRPIN